MRLTVAGVMFALALVFSVLVLWFGARKRARRRPARPAAEETEFIADVLRQLRQDRQRYPRTRQMFAALLEEAGELARAFLEGAPAAQKRKEAVQVCAVAMRLFLDGDEEFSREVGPYDPTKEREES